jgi:hypothetical protein
MVMNIGVPRLMSPSMRLRRRRSKGSAEGPDAADGRPDEAPVVNAGRARGNAVRTSQARADATFVSIAVRAG